METTPLLPGLPSRFQEVAAVGPDAWTARESDGGRRVRILRIPASAGEGATSAPAARIRVRIPHAPEILAFGPLPDGSVWTAERDYEGLSLAEVRSRTGDAGEGMRSLWLDAVQHAAEAVVAAHRAGIVHGALRPDRLLLDERDDATIIGWEHARLIGSTETDAGEDGPWRAPEQVPGATADPRWDIHALGAILHLVLFGTPPTRIGGAKGSLDIPDSSVRIRVADDLATLAFMALQADPGDRVRSADVFLEQLLQARSRVPIAITTETAPSAPARTRGLILAILVVVIAAALWWTMHTFAWRPGETVILAETFADDAWTGRWRGVRGGFQREQGALVSTGGTDSVLILNRRIHPPVSIACTAMIQPGAPMGDLTFLWCESDPFVSDTIYRTNAYLAQTGAYDNTFAGISGSAGRLQLSRRDFILEPGRAYHLRLEIDGDRMRLIVDGTVIADHVSQVPFGAGWIGLLAYYPGKVFDDVVITQRKPGRGDALVVGDALLTRGHSEEAAEEYASVVQRSADPVQVVDIARYRQGVALAAAGRHAEAVTTWGQITTDPWKDLGAIYSQRRWIAIGDHPTVAAGLRDTGPWVDSRLRDAGRAVWGEAIRALGPLPERSSVETALAVRESCLAPDPASAWAAAELAWKVGLYQKALDLSAGDRRAVAWSLLALGRAEEVLTRFPEQVQAGARACLMLDRFDEIFRSYPQVVWAVREAGMATGSVEGAAGHLLDDAGELLRLRLVLGAAPTEAADASLPPQRRLVAALLMDDLATVADLAETSPSLEAEMLQHGATVGLERSRSTGPTRAMAVICRLLEDPASAEAERLWEEVDGWGANATLSELWFARALVLPWLRLGGKAAASDLLAQLPALPGIRATRLQDFLHGRIDVPAYLDQDAALEANGYLGLAQAVRAEGEGDLEAARASYRAYLATPPWQRPQYGSWNRELISEWFARWRLRHLGG